MSKRLFAAVRIVLPLAIVGVTFVGAAVVGVAVAAAAEVRPVDPAELARCAAITGGNERLACYDELAVVAVPGIRIAPATVVSPAAGTTAPAAVASAAAGTATPTAMASRAPGSAASATVAPPAAGTAAPAAVAAPHGGAAAPAVGTATTQPDAAGFSAATRLIPAAGGPAAASEAVHAAAGPAGATQPVPAASANPDDPANFGLTRQQLKVAPAGPASIKATVSQITEDRLSHVYLVLDNGQTWEFTETDPRVRPGDTVTIKRAALGSFLMLTPSRHSYRVERSH